MGEGQDKIARSLLDLEPSAILDLFLVYPDYNSQPDEVFAIHNGSLFKKGVVWQGKTYIPIGLEIDGFELNADGGINRPKIKVANKDYFITSLLKKFNNFKSARIVHKKIFVKYLDDENFDGGNPFGQPDQTAEIFSQKYIIAQKTQENKIFVEFELTSPLDIDNFDVNHRRIMGKYCYWNYRGIGCRYQGPPINKENGDNFKDVDGNVIIPTETTLDERFSIDREYSVGDVVYIEIGGAEFDLRTEEQGNTEESQENTIRNYYVAKANGIKGFKPNENPKYWDKDGCNKKLSSCQLRFPTDGVINRFVGLGDIDVNSASFCEDGGEQNYYLRFASWIATPNGGTEKIQPNETIRNTNKWTLAFNLKNIKSQYVRDYIFMTRWDVPELQLFILNNSFHFEFYDGNAFDQNGEGLKAIFTPPREGLADPEGLKNHPLIIGQRDEKTMFFSEPSVNFYRELSLNGVMKKTEIENFYIGHDDVPPRNSTSMNLDSVCFWTKDLTQAEIERMYNKVAEGGLRAKTYSQLEAEGEISLLQDIGNWWEGAFTGDTELEVNDNPAGTTLFRGIRDKGPYQDDLFLNGYGSAERNGETLKIDTNTYQYNIEETITIGQEGASLPFGGFPGTDGFDFSRDAQ